MPGETEILRESPRFEPTRWSLIASAASSDDERRRQSWNDLLRLYWRPVYRAVRFRWHKGVEEAKDLTQSFFASLFERDALQRYSPDRGRFRTFLQAALSNYLKNAERDASRLKRGGGASPVQIDLADTDTVRETDDLFEREWRRTIFENALQELEPRLLDVVRLYFLQPDRSTYSQIAQALGISETDVTNRLHQAKIRLREIVRRFVRESTSTPFDFDSEMRDLFGAP